MAGAKKNLVVLEQQKKSLPTLTAEANKIEQMLVESYGELTPEIEAKLHFNGVQMREKVDGYGYLLDMLPGRAEFYKRKAELFNRIAKSIKSAEERLEHNLRFAMGELKTDELKGGEYRFKLQRVKSALVITDETAIPDELKKSTVETVPDKDAIRYALEQGDKVPGAELEERFSLRSYDVRDEE